MLRRIWWIASLLVLGSLCYGQVEEAPQDPNQGTGTSGPISSEPSPPDSPADSESDAPSTPETPPAIPADIIVDGQVVLNLYARVGSFSRESRAEIVQSRILRFADNLDFDVELIRVENQNGSAEIWFGQELVVSITQDDADLAGRNRDEMADEALEKIKAAITQYREERSASFILEAIGKSLLVALVTILVLRIIKLIGDWIICKIYRIPRSKFGGLAVKQSVIIHRVQAKRWLAHGIKLFKRICYIVGGYIGLTIILSFFPWTRSYSEDILALIGDQLGTFGKRFIEEIPNLVAVIVIILITWLILKTLKFFFGGIESGQLTWPGFEREWAWPTYKLIRLIVYAGAAIAIFPYLPGSSSPAFQGITVFAGVLLSLGSSGAVANMVAGIVLTYMRPFRLGDRIRVGETIGDVIEKNLLVTRIRTIKNVDITIPNSNLLSAHIENYSSVARQKGLILCTSVTIGYDVPWRDVHAMLIEAANRTDHIVSQPAPFVLQKALNDFYVEYEINAYTRRANRMASIYSDLHGHIQDVFNENGVEIMSSHYTALRDGNTAAMPPDHAGPGTGGFVIKKD
ncbi:mechanosensitive ion channel family protein [Kamptonema cortianum]|nr:mechanosensitive ion channel family protein [Geitlerinema splendidum]MDK3161001.1 mechanosensitive ion channel family protein [Kamptonema cortianum]